MRQTKCMLGQAASSPKQNTRQALICSRWNKLQKIDADDDKKIDPVQSSRIASISEVLINLSLVSARYLADFPNSLYVYAKFDQGYGPRSRGGGLKQKNVQNIIGILLKNILKFRNNRFYKNFYSKNCRILILSDTLFGYSRRKNKD